MSGIIAFVVPAILRNPRRTAAYLAGTVIAVALVSSVLFFVTASANVMTQRTIAPVRVDMQALLNNPNASTSAVKQALLSQPHVTAAERFALAGFAGAQVRNGSRSVQASSGKIMAIDPTYFNTFGAPVLRQGALTKRGIVISLDMGTNLGARVGDSVTLTFGHNVPPLRLPITGIANMLNTDPLFAPIDPLLRLNPFNPPANVAIMDYGLFESRLKHALLANAPSGGTGPVVRSNSPVIEQVQLKLQRSTFPSDPSQAKTYVAHIQRALELSQSGSITVLDNISASLDLAQSDILWAQAIFVFLAIPGVILAAALSRYVTATTIEGQRRELGLLRIRGVGPRQLALLLGVTLTIVAIAGIIVGIGAGWLSSRAAGGAASNLTGAGDPLVVRTLILSVLSGLILGLVAALWPLLGLIRDPITDVRRRVNRARSPLWERLYLDLVCLATALVVYQVIQQNGGFQPVLNAEGNPTVSLSIFAFVSPLLFWIGAILLLLRISRWLVSRSARLFGRWSGAGVVRELAARTIERRAGSLNQALLLVAMATAFSSGLITFVHTYDQQQRVDAELSLGSDVKVTVANLSDSPKVLKHLRVPGVTAVTPFRTTLAYVGAEIQDIFGISVPSFMTASHMANTFFVGNTAAGTLHALQTTPNGILVSQETFRDYSLRLGYTMRIRIYNVHTRAYAPVVFKVVGVAREFATAPKDAFLVTNLAFLSAATGQPGANLFLVKTSGDPHQFPVRLRTTFAHGPLVTVDDISTVQQQISTSLTSLNLTALSRIDYGYTAIMLVVALLVFGVAVILDRRRDFALLQVMGATAGQLRLLLAAEIGFAVLLGTIFGLVVGLGFAQMLTQILTAIFDPPPDALSIPWTSLGFIVGLSVLSGVVAAGVAAARVVRLNLAETLRDV